MKPDLLTKIDQVQAAKLDMTVVAVAESSVIDACYTWMKAQDGWDKLEVKSYLSYNGVVVQPATNPLGNPGWIVQLRTKS